MDVLFMLLKFLLGDEAVTNYDGTPWPPPKRPN